MEIKYRTIRMESNHHTECFAVDEYGIENGEVFHRYIMINEPVYETFKENPDNEIHLDEFLACHDIHAEWKRYALILPTDKHDNNRSSKLLEYIGIENLQRGRTEWHEQTKSEIFKKLYEALSKKETLIRNPLIMDVFNEAFNEDPELGKWESVFPFFR